jgi:LMBR1 domain-containing protein 1
MVVLSMTIAEIMVLLTALDVANRAGAPGCGVPSVTNATRTTTASGTIIDVTTNTTNSTDIANTTGVVYGGCPGSLNTADMWSAMFFVVAVLVAIVLPFNIFFYEANEADRKLSSRICEAIQYQGIALVVAGLTLGLMYWQINMYTYPVLSIALPLATGEAPVVVYSCSTPNSILEGCANNQFFDPFGSVTIAGDASSTRIEFKQQIVNVPNTFGVYLASFMSFIGWFLFCIYTGVGFVTLPIDLIRGYLYRPKYIPKDVYIKLREDIRQRLNELLELGEKMKKDRKQYESDSNKLGFFESRSKNTSQRTAFREFKKAVMQLETDYEDIQMCHEAWSSYNPLIPYLKLAMGILSVIFSACWIIQICLFIFPQYWPGGFSYIPTYFLNDFITWGLIYSGFSLLGVIFIAIFGMYLFACNVNGNFKIGLRFLIMEIHPMKVGGTYMSSFLVNMILLLLQTPALINFIALAFSNSFVLTDIDTIMNSMVRYTTFFVYFFENNVFVWLLMAFTVLAACLVWALPDQGKISSKRLKKRMDKMQNALEDKQKDAQRSKYKGLGLKEITKRAIEANNKPEDGGAETAEGEDKGDMAVA